MTRCLPIVVALLLAGCAGKPPAPDWQVNAQGALERYQKAELAGDTRVATAEFERARRELGATGQPGQVALAELTRCALQVASLDFAPCSGFEALRDQAAPDQRAYADYLAGRITPPQVALLPPQHRAVAAGTQDDAALQAMADPLARLVAAGVLMRSGRASPRVLSLATDTASQQGWRRPLLAWLGVTATRAEKAGATDEAARIRQRMALISGQG